MKNATLSWYVICGVLIHFFAHILTFTLGRSFEHSPDNKMGLMLLALFAILAGVMGILLIAQCKKGFPIHSLSATTEELTLISKTKHNGLWYIFAQPKEGGGVICIYTAEEPVAESGGSFYT